MYRIKTPWWLPKLLNRQMLWKVPVGVVPTIYLTFDDGPHPIATTFILDLLKEHQAEATFFCIGKNVDEHPAIYKRIIADGHAVGNHTHNHLNGWHTPTEKYIDNILEASKRIKSLLFRPPYGRIKRAQAHMLIESKQPWKIVMWDVLSGDFDVELTPEKCLENVLKYIAPGSIVVFHDSQKAWDRMSYALPKVLDHCREKGWRLSKLS